MSEPEVDEIVLAALRAKVLTALDVTEEDLAVLEQRSGYLAAKARHEYAREHFLAHVKAYTGKLTEMIDAELARQREHGEQPRYNVATGRWSDGWGEPKP